MDISTPLILANWAKLLDNHPEKSFVQLILGGIQYGFRVGFSYTQQTLKGKPRNLLSTQDHPAVVDAYISKELALGRIVHIPDPGILPWFHCSPIGIIPKKHKPDKWRLIVDLSAPDGHSVNDGIEKALCSLTYISVDRVAETVLQLGPGTLLAKMDIKEAFRIVPIHPSDRLLLAMQWKGKWYIDKVLPFGLRSAPLLFTALADAVEWVIRQKGVMYIWHYMDDFILAGGPDSDQCAAFIALALQVFRVLGIPIELSKSEGPATTLSVLGIEIDTVAMQLRLPADKLRRLQEATAAWRGRKCCTKRELLSLIGSLQHAATVIRPGRSFVRRMIDLSCSRKHVEARIRLNREFRSDLEWWFHLAAVWNGVSILAPLKAENPDLEITSDASGTWGCGAFSEGEWFQLQWDSSLASVDISIKELIPIIIASMLWGHKWKGKTVRALCDNMAIVHVLRSKHSKDSELMHLLRCLSMIECAYGFTLVSKHLPGKLNLLADALSRDKLPLFRSHYPQALPDPTPIPPVVLQLLVKQKPDWTCTNWANHFRITTFRD